MKILLIMFGGALGSISRFALSGIANKFVSNGFPIGTLIVNLTGSFIIGLLWGFFDHSESSNFRAFLFVGVLGGFTTFSAYSFETITLFRDGNVRFALLNIAANNVLGILLALCGFALTKVLK